MEFNQLLALYSSCIGLITFFLGLFLGHRLSLGREKRKEKISAAEPIRQWIIERRKRPEPSNSDHINEYDLDRYLLTLSRREKILFNKFYENYLSFVDNDNNIELIDPNENNYGSLVIFTSYQVYKDKPLFLKKLADLDKITQHS